MTTRAEQAGLGVSVAAHVALLAVLSLGLFAAPAPLVPSQPSVDVQLVDEVGLTATAPNPSEVAPAPSVAPELGPLDPAPAEPQTVAPESAKPSVAPPKPQPVAKPSPAKPAPIPPRGARLGSDFLSGISDRPSTSTAQTPRAAVGPMQIASLASAIRRQVQPCADRIASPGPGAEQIVTKLNLRMNRDGSFAAAPSVVSQTTDAETARYAARVAELARGAFVQCAPFELPDELYEGWKNINLNYKLPD